MLNQKYLSRIKASVFTHEFIISNRIRKIQSFYKSRYARRVEAAKLICLRSKIFLAQRGKKDMQRARI